MRFPNTKIFLVLNATDVFTHRRRSSTRRDGDVVMGARRSERAPLLPDRGYGGGEATTAMTTSRVRFSDGGLGDLSWIRDGVVKASMALRAMRTNVMTYCDEEEVCARRTTRVRRVTLASTGVLALCCAAAASGSTRAGAGIGTNHRRPALGGESSVDSALDDLFTTNRISELKLEYGDGVRVRPVDPTKTGGKAKKWAEEYKDVIEAKETYDPDFGREGHVFDRHARGLDTEMFSANEPIGQHNAVGGASGGAAPQGGDEFDALSTGLSDSVEIDDSLVVGLGAKEHDIDMDDLMVDAGSVSEHIKKGKKEKSSGAKKEERSNSKKSSSSDDDDEDEHRASKGAAKSTRDKHKESKQQHYAKKKVQKKPSAASRADAIKDMTFDEIGLKTSKKSLMQQIKDLKERLKHPKSANRRRGRLSQYPHHSKDQDENDENDSEVFYKKSDLLDLGEYNQATIDDFKYGRGLEPRHSGTIHSLTVDDVDVSNYPSSGDGSVHYPSRTASAGDIENDPDALQSLMSSLHVTAKKANSHAKSRKKQQKVERAADERQEKREDAKVAKKAESLDWGSGGGSKSADALDWSGASTKKSGSSTKKDALDWSDGASSSASHKLSAKNSKKTNTAVKAKSTKTAKHVDESPKHKHESSSSSSSSSQSNKPKGERSTKIGRMSKEMAAKYLSKVKGHNEETHKSLRRVNPKLGATKKSSVPVDDDLYEDASPTTSETRLPKEHNERHKTVAEVVEAAAQEEETSHKAALGRKPSAIHHLKHATAAEVQRGGAWRRIFSKIFRGKEYSAAREHIFSSKANE